MAAPFNKRALNAFNGTSRDGTGGGNVVQDASAKKVINAVGVYESDYGVMKVVPNRFLRSRDVLVYEKAYWAIATLRPMFTKDIAATGDAQKKQVIMEAGLMAKNEKSSGIILDLTTS